MKSALDATNPSELLKRAAWDRDLAKRAAGFAEWLLWDADRARLLGHAKRLEEEAAGLEKQAAALAPPVTLSVGLEDPLITPDPPTEDQVDPEEKPKHQPDSLGRNGRDMPKSRLYSIEIKDVRTDQVMVIAAADCTEDQKRLAVAQIKRLVGLRDNSDLALPTAPGLKRGTD